MYVLCIKAPSGAYNTESCDMILYVISGEIEHGEEEHGTHVFSNICKINVDHTK